MDRFATELESRQVRDRFLPHAVVDLTVLIRFLSVTPLGRSPAALKNSARKRAAGPFRVTAIGLPNAFA